MAGRDVRLAEVWESDNILPPVCCWPHAAHTGGRTAIDGAVVGQRGALGSEDVNG
jgi:hypothetical protein